MGSKKGKYEEEDTNTKISIQEKTNSEVNTEAVQRPNLLFVTYRWPDRSKNNNKILRI